ncbi:MAG: pyridoxamine 5'-phosphate oxidase family protein [Acidimicrobiales bacterium]
MTDTSRAVSAMSEAEVGEFLAAERRCHVATLDGDGGIDLVPMAYLLWEGRLGLWTDQRSKKVRNLRRDPAITVLVERGEIFDELRAVELRGRAQIFADLDVSRRAGEMLFGRGTPGGLSAESRAAAVALAPERVLIVVEPDIVISWDHRKLSGLTPGQVGH